MISKRNNLYVIPVILLLLHLMLAGVGFYLYTAFKADLVPMTAELQDARIRMRQVNETELNKNFILDLMSSKVRNHETFMQLFKMLGAIGGLAAGLSIAWIIEIYKYRAAAD
jgi:hypothetical protein